MYPWMGRGTLMPLCEVLFLQSHGSIDTMHIAHKIIVIEPHKKFSRDWGNSIKSLIWSKLSGSFSILLTLVACQEGWEWRLLDIPFNFLHSNFPLHPVLWLSTMQQAYHNPVELGANPTSLNSLPRPHKLVRHKVMELAFRKGFNVSVPSSLQVL